MDKAEGDKFGADICKLLLEFVIHAHKELLRKHGEIEYEPSFQYTPHPIIFDPANYLRFHSLTISKSGGTYWIQLQALDELEQYLKHAGFPTIFTTTLVNQDFRRTMLIDEEITLKKVFYNCLFKKRIAYAKLNQEKIESAITDIDKLLMLPRIKYC